MVKHEHTTIGIAVSFGCSSLHLRIEPFVSRFNAGLDTTCLPLSTAVSSVSSLRSNKSSNDIMSMSVALRAALAALLGVAIIEVSSDSVRVKKIAYPLC